MKKLTKQQILIILIIACCSIAFLYLLITNIHSIVDACKHLETYNHLLENSDLVVDLSKENIILTIDQLKKSILKISFSILSFSVLFSTSLWLLIKQLLSLRVKNGINPPTV